MKRLKRTVFFGSLIFSAGTTAGQQVVLDFESVVIPVFATKVTVPAPYAEKGFLIGHPDGGCDDYTHPPVFEVNRGGGGVATQALSAFGDRQFWVVVEGTNGTFDLVSFQAQTPFVENGVPPFDMLGIRQDGTFVSGTFIPTAAFTTIQPAGFTNLVAFAVINRGAGSGSAKLDNIVLENVQHGNGFPMGETILDFEEVVLPNQLDQNIYGRLYYKDGYMLADVNEDTETAFRFFGAEAFGYAGSKAISAVDLFNEGAPRFWISRIDAAPFWIESVDAAALTPYQTEPIGMYFAGVEFQHTEPNPDDATPGFLTYPLNVQNDPCRLTNGSYPLQFDNIRLTTIEPPPPCAADFNGVNGVSVQDIFDFLTAWLSGSPSADFNTLNGVTVQDIFDFLTAWLAGC